MSFITTYLSKLLFNVLIDATKFLHLLSMNKLELFVVLIDTYSCVISHFYQ
jgi:hypothetical protein